MSLRTNVLMALILGYRLDPELLRQERERARRLRVNARG